jgi:hypothetical protein
MPEYCAGFGIPFVTENFEQKLEEMMESYDYWADRMKEYPHSAERMCRSYYELFEELLDRRNEIIAVRKWWRRSVWLMRFLISS